MSAKNIHGAYQMLKISVGLDITKFSHANIDIGVKVLAVDVAMNAV